MPAPERIPGIPLSTERKNSKETLFSESETRASVAVEKSMEVFKKWFSCDPSLDYFRATFDQIRDLSNATNWLIQAVQLQRDEETPADQKDKIQATLLLKSGCLNDQVVSDYDPGTDTFLGYMTSQVEQRLTSRSPDEVSVDRGSFALDDEFLVSASQLIHDHVNAALVTAQGLTHRNILFVDREAHHEMMQLWGKKRHEYEKGLMELKDPYQYDKLSLIAIKDYLKATSESETPGIKISLDNMHTLQEGTVKLPPRWFESAVENIVANAASIAQAVEEPEPQMTVVGDIIELEDGSENFVLSFTDNCGGFPAPLVKVGTFTGYHTREGGNGIGMRNITRVVNTYGGSLSLENVKQQWNDEWKVGARIILSFPLVV